MRQAHDIQISATGRDATLEIQAAIDSLTAMGGGRVSLRNGRHLCRGLRLASHVELHLAQGSTIAPVPDYMAYDDNRVSVIAENSDRAMIIARNADQIAITGTGKIEAGGKYFIDGNDEVMGTYVPAARRPRVVVLEACQNVKLEDFTVDDSPMWTLHLVNCEDVIVSRVRISNDRLLPNTDGIVLDACRRARIEECHISTADDGICLKTSAGPDQQAVGACQDIMVRGCHVSSLSCALKLGTESFGDFTNIAFEDCTIYESNRGLGLFSRDGGVMRNIRFSRIDVRCRETPGGFWGSGEALTVTQVDRRPERPAQRIENLIVEGLTGSMEGAINLISASQAGIHNIALERISLEQREGQLGTGQQFDMRPTNADIAPSSTSAGRANAWTCDSAGKIVGLHDYPGGMPAIFLAGVDGFSARDVIIERINPLAKGWNEQEIVAMTTLPEGSR
ncbi:glycoside hydrolase family 28 protein [Agrobacterium larrymoorei]|uniref:polygalacturonase PglB n=1 Tax=Agrobacterium larrymoorei TaxID=160699 RepID=UPI00157491F2|nr:glycoside hydrolase family 28 protein [Agrobacterium larrymoorei]NTJ44462.1 glycoside hydrolase family 28 protein [Agrobacterium larrymoorei]